MPSKTQAAYERYLGACSGEERGKALADLTHIAIRKCAGLHPPVFTDECAENNLHAHRRYRTNRYAWIQHWFADELENPRPDDTGARLMTRCRWRLLDEIRKEYAHRHRIRKDLDRVPKRLRREKLPSREELVSHFEACELPANEVLRDLWERLLDAYPDWRLATNRHLAVIFGVHPNVIASRRHALAAFMHRANEQHAGLLRACLRLRIGRVRKTDIHKVEEDGILHRKELVTVPRLVGYVRLMDWSRDGTGVAQLGPIYAPIERPVFLRRTRCPHTDSETGIQCVYALGMQSMCPIHGGKGTI